MQINPYDIAKNKEKPPSYTFLLSYEKANDDDIKWAKSVLENERKIKTSL